MGLRLRRNLSGSLVPARRPLPPLSQLGPFTRQPMSGQAFRHCFLSICCHTRVCAHMHTQTCISQGHEHAHVHALTHSTYLYLHEQPGERRREAQNRSRSPVGLPPVPHNTRGLRPRRDWLTPWGPEVGREPPGERKATSLRDPRCTSLGTAVRP